MSDLNKFGRKLFVPNIQNMPGTPAHAAEWAIERGEDPYLAALVRLVEMINERKNKS